MAEIAAVGQRHSCKNYKKLKKQTNQPTNHQAHQWTNLLSYGVACTCLETRSNTQHQVL